MSCGVGHRPGLDPMLLCLWCRPAAVALIHPLVWEPPYAAGMALKKKKKVSVALVLNILFLNKFFLNIIKEKVYFSKQDLCQHCFLNGQMSNCL